MSSWGMSLIGLLAADGTGVCVRPVGVRPVAGRSGPDRGRGDNGCVAEVPDVLSGRGAARAGGWERGAVADRPAGRVCPVDDQPADGGDLRVVRFPGDAGSVPGESGAEVDGGPPIQQAQRGGLLAHLDRPKSWSRLRVREPRRLPRGLDRAETAALLGSFRSDRDRAIAGLMLFSGLRSAEVLGLQVRDVDIPRRWVRVVGKGDKERTVTVDVE